MGINVEALKNEVLSEKEAEAKAKADARTKLIETFVKDIECLTAYIEGAVKNVFRNGNNTLTLNIRGEHRLQMPYTTVSSNGVKMTIGLVHKVETMTEVQALRSALAEFFGIPLDINHICVNGYEKDEDGYFTYNIVL